VCTTTSGFLSLFSKYLVVHSKISPFLVNPKESPAGVHSLCVVLWCHTVLSPLQDRGNQQSRQNTTYVYLGLVCMCGRLTWCRDWGFYLYLDTTRNTETTVMRVPKACPRNSERNSGASRPLRHRSRLGLQMKRGKRDPWQGRVVIHMCRGA
jgi:hypothetical protein